MAKDHLITKGDLKSKIERLHEDGHITKALHDVATEIRFAGIEAAHGDLVAEPLGIEDATEIVGLMDLVLQRAGTVS